VIEHNLDVIKTADRVIDLVPWREEGGGSSPKDAGTGLRGKESATGFYLKKVLARRDAGHRGHSSDFNVAMFPRGLYECKLKLSCSFVLLFWRSSLPIVRRRACN